MRAGRWAESRTGDMNEFSNGLLFTCLEGNDDDGASSQWNGVYVTDASG